MLLVIHHHGPLIGIFHASDWAASRLVGAVQLPLALGTEVGGGSSKGPARGQWSLEQSPSSEAVTVSWYRGIAYARTLLTA